jgi:WD40 repeat protein/serine/threonine protein kinase
MNAINPGNREREIFEQALDLPSAEERAAFLQGACAGDDPLLARLQGLLRAHSQSQYLRDEPQAPTVVVSPDTVRMAEEGVGAVIGRYKLLEALGEGGFGAVWLAEQKEPVRRKVALKVIKLGLDTKPVVARFEAERQALALMDHPNIARVLDAGTTEAGRPYFVMELVRGTRITKYCDLARLSTRKRLELFVQVCHAIQHAHQKGIIHRDIKPSNILVTVNDPAAVGVPKVIDFGIAKATNQQQLTDKTVFTAFDQFIGTPAYMSPEQTVMTSLNADTRSDIYSLGVLLYELLTGKTPFDSQELVALGLEEMCRTIREKDPIRPSTRLATMDEGERFTTASRHQADAPNLIGLLRGDIDWIVMKCLEKDRQHRYETADALAADIDRHLRNEPVLARPPSALYRLQKAICRNKIAAAAAAAVTSALVIGLGAALWQASMARSARDRADAAREREALQRRSAQTERDRALVETRRAEAARDAAERNAYAAAMTLAQAAWDDANITLLRRILDESQAHADKGFEWYHWQRLCRSELQTLRDHDAVITCVAYSPDGAHIATGSEDRTIRIRDATTGAPQRILVGHAAGLRTIAFAIDNRRLLSVDRGGDVRLWDTVTGMELFQARGQAAGLAPGGSSIAIATVSGQIRLLDTASAAHLLEVGTVDHPVHRLEFSPDGTDLLAVGPAGELHLWHLPGGGGVESLWSKADPKSGFLAIGPAAAFSPNGRHIATGGHDRVVRILDASTGQVLQSFVGHAESIHALAFSPDGRLVASAGRDRTIRLWDSATGRSELILSGHTESVRALAFAADGKRLASGGMDRTLKIWEARHPIAPRRSGGIHSNISPSRFGISGEVPSDTEPKRSRGLQDARFSPDGRRIVSATKDGLVRVHDTASLVELLTLRGHTEVLSHANFSRDGRLIYSGAHDFTLRIWDGASGQELRILSCGRSFPFWSRIAPDNRSLAAAMEDGSIRLFDLTDGTVSRQWIAHPGGTWCVEYSPDGRLLATSGEDGLVRVWDAFTHRELQVLRGHRGAVIPLAFSPDGTRVASGGARDFTIRVWDLSHGREVMNLRGHSDLIPDVQFSPDGRRLVSAAFDKTVRVWDVGTGRELLTLRGSSDYYMTAAFSPNGNHIVCAGDQPELEVWSAATEEELRQWTHQESEATQRWSRWDRAQTARAEQAQTNLIRSWWVVGPFQVDYTQPPLQQFRKEQARGEASFRPPALTDFAGRAVTPVWQKVQSKDGLLDFGSLFGDTDTRGKAAYAVTYVRSSQVRRRVWLIHGNDDLARIYLNGTVVSDDPVGGRFVVDEHVAGPVELRQGLNVVVMKVINGFASWQATLRVADANGNPVPELETGLDPE